MNESTLFGHESGGQSPPGSARQASAAPHKFSPEELRVLQECNTESFFQRSLPLGTMFGLGAFFGVQQGHFKPNPRFGAFPKVTLAVIVGYFLGKLSYQQACAEKLMALPGSYIGQLLRERKEGKFSATRAPAPPTMFGAAPGDIYSDAGPGNSLDLDTDRPLFSEDSFNATSEYEPELSPPRPVQSYDELRRLNRGEYNDARQDPYKVDPNSAPAVTRPSPRPATPSVTNKYGDEME
ncbi:OCIA domain-containing protein 1 isoform X4 [Pieris brassicae]|uniref:OCIA domain-containing protein 1 isoform X4 n=1 Tax=Pieris brassicae TaxID=7116 RepID=UPI001E66255F|nr:OCIA domain-containing protein 1 isoform X4 [Pieris brassicae]